MSWIEAGLDPARFWDITPRLIVLELRGAERRAQRQRELVWWAAALPYLKKPMPLDKFIGAPVDQLSRVERFHAAWDKLDQALSRAAR